MISWNKSSYSFVDECVEVGIEWDKSSYSYDIGTCVEVGVQNAVRHVRDTENRELGYLTFPAGELGALMGALR